MTLPVPTPPDLPLARTVRMPEHVGYPSGALTLRFAELTVEPDGQPHAVPVSDGDRTIVALPPLVVRARCAIDATPDEVATVDGGGDLSVLPDSATAPRSADDQDKHPEWLDNARTQRMSLAQTENGRSLLNLYGLHEDVYADLFDESRSRFAKNVWSKGGGTTAMAADTHAALADETGDQVVNDPFKTYHDHQGNPGSYNYNAFVRQFAAATYTLALDPDYDPSQGLPDQGKYYEASKATFDFADSVRTTTGNDRTTTSAMTRDDVFNKVQEHTGDLAAATRPGHRSFDAVRNPFADDVWEGWDDDERDLIREFHRMAVEDRLALRAAATPTTVFEGTGTARITGAAAVTDATGAVRVELPAFELVLDDATWSGAAADVARDRLNAAGFVADLVRDAVAERLRVAVVAADPALLADPGR
ncbi:hypothetical protein [Saccharothrix texasensis]|uniref:Uncharacterized protein n=1 Tax=Saccharothrix texasensis TaxID=103734 RepID=A0A3N1GX69_9PSEU|nr:hypothetical protein [Saccharothrix texasensis]ROP34840.1 hypothetical protein EDD40_0044 [Saccharothrix texasensis]